MHHDDIELSAGEQAAFAELVAAWPTDDGIPIGSSRRHDLRIAGAGALVAIMAVVTLILGGLLAATGTGFVACCGAVAWSSATVAALGSLVLNSDSPGWPPTLSP